MKGPCERHIVDIIAEDFEKLRDVRSFNFDPQTYLTVTGSNQAGEEQVTTKFMQNQKKSKILTTAKGERYLIEIG